MEVPSPAPLLRLRGALARPGHAMGGVRAERRSALGKRAARHPRLPGQRVEERGAAR